MLATTAVCVAVVTDGRSIAIAVYIGVGLVGLGLLMSSLGMTIDAGKAGVVGGNLVAIVAHRLVVWNGEIGMVESRAKPRSCRMASVTSCWITRRHVIGNAAAQSLRAVPIGGVASVASRVCGRKAVIVADMTEIASRS